MQELDLELAKSLTPEQFLSMLQLAQDQIAERDAQILDLTAERDFFKDRAERLESFLSRMEGRLEAHLQGESSILPVDTVTEAYHRYVSGDQWRDLVPKATHTLLAHFFSEVEAARGPNDTKAFLVRAVRTFRGLTGVGLKEAKDWVEAQL